VEVGVREQVEAGALLLADDDRQRVLELLAALGGIGWLARHLFNLR